MRGRLRTLIGLFVSLAISVFALALAIRWAGLEPLIKVLKRVDIRFLAAAVLIFFISMGMRVASWWTILGRAVSPGRVLAAINQGYLLNNILPWRMGELGRAVLLGRRSKLTVQGVLSSIVIERVYDVTLALTLLLGLLPLAAGLPGISQSALMGGIVLTSVVVGVWVVLHRPDWMERLLHRLPGGMARWGNHWVKFRDGLQVLRSTRVLLVSLLWMVGSWALAGVEYWFVLRSLIMEAKIEWAYFMLTVTMLGVAIPSSPGYIGVFEAAGVLALSVFGVPGDQALAAALVQHALVYSIGSGLGAVAMLGEGENLLGIYRDVRAWLKADSLRQAE